MSFLSTLSGGLLPEPLPYPFVPRRVEPPVRVGGLVQQVTFIGPELEVSAFATDLPGPAPIQELAIAGTAVGDMFYIDLGAGTVDGGPLGDAGIFPCPPTLLAPRLVDINDYLLTPVGPEIDSILATDPDGGQTLGTPALEAAPVALTALGGALPQTDRLGAGFDGGPGTAGTALPILSCYSLPSEAQLCVTSGLVQKGVAEDEQFVVTYGGALQDASELTVSLAGNTLTAAGVDFTALSGGLLQTEQANLTVVLSGAAGACGAYGISAVTSAALTLQPSGATGCGAGLFFATIYASGAKPFTVLGTTTGFVNALWPADGTLHLVPSRRWHYPVDLIHMAGAAEQLADFVFGPLPGMAAAPGSSLTVPRPDGRDSDALDSPFGLALWGPLGSGSNDAGVIASIDGGYFEPLPGARWGFTVTSGVQALAVNPSAAFSADGADSLIDGMASYIDVGDAGADGGVPHVFGAYRGGNALIELDPEQAYGGGILAFH